MICNRNGITSVGRWEFVKAFVEDFVAILVAIHFATPFATKNDRENFVEISSKISLLQLKFDEIWTNCLTKFWRFFLWQNVVAKRFATTFCHKKNSSKISLLRFKFWRNPNEILTKEFVAKSCGKTFCHKAPDEKSDEILTKWKRKKQQRKSLYQNILQVVGNHGGVRSQFIVYFQICHRGKHWSMAIPSSNKKCQNSHRYPKLWCWNMMPWLKKVWSQIPFGCCFTRHPATVANAQKPVLVELFA